MLKISSYNINGVRAAYRKGLMTWIEKTSPDIICFQEFRADIEQVPEELKSRNIIRSIMWQKKRIFRSGDLQQKGTSFGSGRYWS